MLCSGALWPAWLLLVLRGERQCMLLLLPCRYAVGHVPVQDVVMEANVLMDDDILLEDDHLKWRLKGG